MKPWLGETLEYATADGGLGPAVKDTYRELFERSADAILVIEGERFIDANQAAVEMLRCESRGEVLRTHPSQLSPPVQPDGRDSFDKANEMIALALERGSHRFEWLHRRTNGEDFPVEVLLTAVEAEGHRRLHVVWRDIAERKRLETQLRQSSKMEAIGRLAGGIAHDFNNLLVAIIGYSEMITSRVAHDAELVEWTNEITDAGERAATLVRQLLTFSRKQELQPRVVDLVKSVAGVQGLLQRLLGEGVTVNTAVAPEPVALKIDPGQLEQVIINLCTNARDAMDGDGTLTIEARRVRVADERIGTSREIPGGNYAQLVVTDTGKGMEQSTIDQVFEPFFTTKEMGRGTGLGLATVYGIVRQGGGAIDIYSVVGKGTTFKVYFPLCRGDVAHEDPLGELPTHGGDETIMVVEDESAVAGLVVGLLRRKGYRVLVARDGKEALQRWEDHVGAEGQIHLLLTDVVMPKMGGPALVNALRRRGFTPRVLYASGYTNEALSSLRETADNEPINLMEKPFSPAELIGRVRLALER